MVLFRSTKSTSTTRPLLAGTTLRPDPLRKQPASIIPTAEQNVASPAQVVLQKLERMERGRQEDQAIRDLNESLAALVHIFPDVQVEVFREMLSSIEEESRLAVVADLLVRDKSKWAHGRLRVPTPEESRAYNEHIDSTRSSLHLLPREESFRSPAYIDAVKALCCTEFKGLSRATVSAVLAEHNYSYTLARPQLVVLAAKSWRHMLSSIFARKKSIAAMESEKHPMVIWQSTGIGPLIPTLKGSGSQELDKELFDTLILPQQQRIAKELAESDRSEALTRAAANDDIECECCFTSVAFEQVVACNDGCHMFCYDCVRRGVNEAVFGQGWQKNIDGHRGTLLCMAAFAADCQGCVSSELIQRAFADVPSGAEVLRKLDERLVHESVAKLTSPLVRCPFCAYAEVDDLYLPDLKTSWQFKGIDASSYITISAIILCMGSIPFLLPIFLLLSAIFLLLSTRGSFADYTVEQFYKSLVRLRRRRIGLRFRCQNPACGRASCLACSKAWVDIHKCHESTLIALRTQIELAMSQAVKRTCPVCNTSFVKSAGCNKLTCVCGYQMCYVCRQDIGKGEGYRHFCEHFRPTASGHCTECSKCDLYRCEDDDVAVQRAKHAAEQVWFKSEGSALTPGERDELKRVMAGGWDGRHGHLSRSETWGEMLSRWASQISVEHLLDILVEQFVE